ncbi:MAG: YlbF family regulator [Firmicutes bacterium]|nr:YlbF family regulator [Clostridiales bacterium]MBQ4339829.1 YlbF family regulator [Bacillota bacterium]
MNIYDEAHGLARAIKASDEYKNYVKIKAEVSAIPELNEMLGDFQQKQFQLQAAQFTGQEVEADVMQQIQDLYQIIMKDPKAMEYMQAEMMFTRVIADIYKILEDAVKVE